MQNGKIRRWKPLTISVPETMLKQLDYIRNDVSRSRYIQRLIQEHMKFLDTAVELWYVWSTPHTERSENQGTSYYSSPTCGNRPEISSCYYSETQKHNQGCPRIFKLLLLRWYSWSGVILWYERCFESWKVLQQVYRAGLFKGTSFIVFFRITNNPLSVLAAG